MEQKIREQRHRPAVEQRIRAGTGRERRDVTVRTADGGEGTLADKSDAGITLTTSKLKVVAEGLQGIEKTQLAEVAKEAEGGCPISNALRGTRFTEPASADGREGPAAAAIMWRPPSPP